MNPYECAWQAFRDAGVSTLPVKEVELYVQFELYKQAMRNRPDIPEEDREERLLWAQAWQQSIVDRLLNQQNKQRMRIRKKRQPKKRWVAAVS